MQNKLTYQIGGGLAGLLAGWLLLTFLKYALIAVLGVMGFLYVGRMMDAKTEEV